MQDNQQSFQANHTQRTILVVDDEAINRALLGGILEEQYTLLYAENGAEAIEQVRGHADTLSLVLLDLLLPDRHGLDILRELKSDARLSRIPVIVVTSDKEAEVESLTIGAIDFIPKPYPSPKVVLARVLRTIELSEDRDIIRWTERDTLTNLYNREYFYRYAEQFDLHHRTQAMDAIVVDINHFHMINERYGKAYADRILQRVAARLQAQAQVAGGIVCRLEADTFLIYVPHGTDYAAILDSASADDEARLRLRMGVYADVDKGIDIERRFDRAKLAADTVRTSYTRAIAIYDNALHESEMFSEQLLDGFSQAIEQKQFMVWYQPKYDIRPAEPVLNSAEALVRWKHPQLGMVSPGVFVPLFESNGLVQQLDRYVWREAARQIRDWKDRLGVSVPVSVNVSRVDMLDPGVIDIFEGLVKEFSLNRGDLLLEITESAYTQDSDQMIAMVDRLRELGYFIEMDDFGSGYSSLNMISTLPVDALKLDMQFVRNAFRERKNTRMLEVVLDLAASLDVPTIAEGVETAEQLFTLKTMGCDLVQGYYFSRPVPAEEFERFLLARRQAETAESPASPQRAQAPSKLTYDALHDPVTGLYNASAFDMLLHDADQEHIAVLVAAVNDFRTVATAHGTDITEPLLRRVASVLRGSFRSVDFVCRLSPEEFAIIMSRVNSSMRKLVFDKVEQVNALLAQPEDGLPPVSLSVGVAFADRENPQGDILHDADTALYRMKEVRRCGCAVY